MRSAVGRAFQARRQAAERDQPPSAWQAIGVNTTSIEHSKKRRVVARAVLALGLEGAHAFGERRAGQNVVDPPPDVALPQVPPWRPPGEELGVVRIQLARDVHESLREDAFEQRALLRQLADRARLAFLGMHVDLEPRDVEITADDERRARRTKRLREPIHRFQEAHLSRKVLAAVRHVNGRHAEPRVLEWQAGHHYAVLEIERRVRELRFFRKCFLPHVEPDARIPFLAVPITPVALEVTEQRRKLGGGSLDFLQAQDVGPLAFDPVLHLGRAGADAVHVPGGDLHAASAWSTNVLIAAAGRAPEVREISRPRWNSAMVGMDWMPSR